MARRFRSSGSRTSPAALPRPNNTGRGCTPRSSGPLAAHRARLVALPPERVDEIAGLGLVAARSVVPNDARSLFRENVRHAHEVVTPPDVLGGPSDDALVGARRGKPRVGDPNVHEIPGMAGLDLRDHLRLHLR